ncbi:predicted protein [Plenodomus lingam JN3]|uniref:Predicted protein n=1 Tax=Leptosphaeria maculans (strain JN3 / isolate v23.1.3 / race Av1-4-5-6-7-8) TaxID=985895 RepID=E5A3K1_LEPMJ|nr:predicted protein [Plenodomus lingam JN3]CBX98214.1 predicted protein [Plenodomus lingam JN3]
MPQHRPSHAQHPHPTASLTSPPAARTRGIKGGGGGVSGEKKGREEGKKVKTIHLDYSSS